VTRGLFLATIQATPAPFPEATIPTAPPSRHLFSVDVEDYFQVVAFEPVVSRDAWDRYPSRVERNTDRLLALLDRHGAFGTFFVLGWVAARFKGLVRRIAEAGHEVASHGFWHRRVTTLTPAEFRQDIRESKAVLEDASGLPCLGFRAPSFSIVPGTEWAFDVLLEEGYRYDSSLFPIHRPDYGYPAAPREAHTIRRPAGDLLELPLATLQFGPARWPAAGGGYLRHFPPGLIHRAFRQFGRRGIPAMFYIHPWEIDPGQPRIPCGVLTRWRHYAGLGLTEPRLEHLLSEFAFTSVAREFGPEWREPAAAGGARP
jgi:polysaccharide deacetylase family protein (PEP-CTERM system associated)